MEKLENIQAIVLAIPILFLLMGRSKAAWAKGFKMAGAWIIILLLVVTAAVYWEDFKTSKIYASLVAGAPAMGEGGEMIFIRADDGHFHINATIEGKSIDFMVDTGAADVVLNKDDAERLGIDTANLKYDRFFTTANGMTRGATITLNNFKIDNYEVGNVNASVNEGELDNSLLGMTFLNKMKFYRIEGERMVLKP